MKLYHVLVGLFLVFSTIDDPVWTQELDIDPPINDTDDDYNFHTQGITELIATDGPDNVAVTTAAIEAPESDITTDDGGAQPTVADGGAATQPADAPTQAPAGNNDTDPDQVTTEAGKTEGDVTTEAQPVPVVTDAVTVKTDSNDTVEQPVVTDVITVAGETVVEAEATTAMAAEATEPQAVKETTAALATELNVLVAETTVAAVVPPVVTEEIKPSDPCSSYMSSDSTRRHYESVYDPANGMCDRDMKPGWWRFQLEGKPAEVPTTCVKMDQCGTKHPVYVELHGMPLPQVEGVQIVSQLTTVAMVNDQMKCGVPLFPVTIRRCQGFYIYQVPDFSKETCDQAMCLKLSGDIIPEMYKPNGAESTQQPEPEQEGIVTVEFTLGKGQSMPEDFNETFREAVAAALNWSPTVTTAIPAADPALTTQADATTEAGEEDEPTTVATEEKVTAGASTAASAEEPSTAAVVEQEEATDAPGETEKLEVGHDAADDFENVAKQSEEETFPDAVDPDASGPAPPISRRKRHHGDMDDHVYKADDVVYEEPTPREGGGVVQATVYVKQDDGTVVEQDKLESALIAADKRGDMSGQMNMAVNDIYRGSGRDLPDNKPQTGGRADIWETHMGLFITVLVLAAICLIVIIVGLVCLRCKPRDRSEDRTPCTAEEGKKVPLGVIENPMPDEEIMREEAPMAEHEPLTPNGANSQDNGWVVPLEQLTNQEREQPDVESTRM